MSRWDCDRRDRENGEYFHISESPAYSLTKWLGTFSTMSSFSTVMARYPSGPGEKVLSPGRLKSVVPQDIIQVMAE